MACRPTQRIGVPSKSALLTVDDGSPIDVAMMR
jgi:hypothetical protein